jgi:predicted nucleic-acid-binding protein
VVAFLDAQRAFLGQSKSDSAADFADCLIEARNRRLGCPATATFDGGALKVPSFILV